MATVQHSALTGSALHITKGLDTALAGAIIVGKGGTQDTTDNASATVNLFDNQLIRPSVKDYAEVGSLQGNLGATPTIDLENGNFITGTLDSNAVFTFTNPPTTGNAGAFALVLTQDGIGNRLVTWPGTVIWEGGITPTLSTGPGERDVLSFFTSDAGVIWYGFLSGKGMS